MEYFTYYINTHDISQRYSGKMNIEHNIVMLHFINSYIFDGDKNKKNMLMKISLENVNYHTI